ncbi:MAG: capsular biosynthesis protein [Hyphomicrobiales bacterium]|nr:capsular biosynthesis protein [Hyphomicrobiales bacterium]
MIDLHSHLLPGIDDGARDLDMALTMARAAVDGGVKVQACTPHIMPGVWNNTGPAIQAAVAELQGKIDEEGIPLRLVAGADVHVVPNLVAGLQSGHLLSLAGTRYVLIEPPHHVAPPRLDEAFFGLLTAGYVPILTHPERLAWVESHYDMVVRLARSGVWMQITSGSLTGSFGSKPKYWGERMLDDGLVHLLASDTHNMKRRPPDLAYGREAAARIVGEEEARNLVLTRPYGILRNSPPSELPQPLVESARGGYASVPAKQNSRKTRGRKTDRKTDMSGHGSSGDSGIVDWMRRLFQRRA